MHPRYLLLLLLVLCGLATQRVLAQGPTISPSRLILEPQRSTSYSKNSTTIHWRRGNASNYVVLISALNYQYSDGSVLEPDERPYTITGNYRMEPGTLIPKNPNSPPCPRSTTYLLHAGAYSSPGDTTAAVLNAVMGVKYIVKVFEFDTDLDGNSTGYYTSTNDAYFTCPAAPPVITSLRIEGPVEWMISWKTAAESTSRSFIIRWSTDSTDFSDQTHSKQVGPRRYPVETTYSESIRTVTSTNTPTYFRVELESGTDVWGFEKSYSKALLVSPQPLPVNLVVFEAKRVATSIQLVWTTASELNNAAFQVERSTDGRTWLPRTTIAGHGTSTQTREYRYEELFTQAAYYRLAQLDYSGQLTYSAVRYVAGSTAAGTLSLYPNPATDIITLTGTSATAPTDLRTIQGQLLRTYPAGQTTIRLIDLAAGTYLVQQAGQTTRLLVR